MAFRIRTLIVLVSLTLLASAAVLAPPAAQAADLNTRAAATLVADGGVAIAWQGPQLASSSAKAPRTAVAWGRATGFNPAKPEHQTEAPSTSAVIDRWPYYRATLTVSDGLLPGQAYAYAIVNLDSGAIGPVQTFQAPSPTAPSVTFVAISQAMWHQTSANSLAQTVAAATEQVRRTTGADPAFLTHSGQLVSTNDTAHNNAVFTALQPTLASVPFAATAHYSGTANRFLTANLAQPSTGNDTNNYAFIDGDVVVLAINTVSTSTASANSTAAWILQQSRDLGTNPATGEQRWIVALTDLSFWGAARSASTYKKTVENAFDQAGVALVIQGGSEAYVRTVPIKAGQAYTDYPSDSQVATSDGVVYLSPGAASERQEAPSAAALNKTTGWVQCSSNFSATATRDLAAKKMYSTVTATRSTLTITARTVDGSAGCSSQPGVYDTTTITRLPTPPTSPQVQTAPMGFNGFGADARTQRSFSWQSAPTNGNYTISTTGYVDVVAASGPATAADFNSPAARHFPATGQAITDTQLFPKQLQFSTTATGLTPGQTYYYRLRNSGVRTNGATRDYLTPTWSFTTESASTNSFTFIDFADSQNGSSSSSGYDVWGATLSAALEKYASTHDGAKPPFVLQNGDTVEVVNASGTAQYTAWYDATDDDLRDIAFYSVLGNHESNSAGNYSCTAPNNKDATLSQLFAQTGEDGGYALSYSFTYGNALILAINTNHCANADLAKIEKWAQDTIAAKGAGKFVIAVMHKPAYGGSHSNDWDTKNQIRGGANGMTPGTTRNPAVPALEPALEAMGVDLVLAGHDHNYIRSYPSKNVNGVSALTKTTSSVISSSGDGTVTLVPGFAGAKVYSLASLSGRPWISVLEDPKLAQPPLSERPAQAQQNSQSYSMVTVSSSQIQVTSCWVATGVCFDSFTITG